MTAQKKYKVTLTVEERETLMAIIKRGESKAYLVRHAQILLNADSEGDNRSDEEICQMIKCQKKAEDAALQGQKAAMSLVWKRLVPPPNLFRPKRRGLYP